MKIKNGMHNRLLRIKIVLQYEKKKKKKTRDNSSQISNFFNLYNPLHQLDIKLMKNIFNSDVKTINYFFDLYPIFKFLSIL